MRKIEITYYEEIKSSSIASAVLDNGYLKNVGGTLYKIHGSKACKVCSAPARKGAYCKPHWYAANYTGHMYWETQLEKGRKIV